MSQYSKKPPEYPRRQRHYFHVDLPEDMRGEKPENVNNAWMDVSISDDSTVGSNIVIDDWGVVFDGQCIQPVWVSQQMLEDEKLKICIR